MVLTAFQPEAVRQRWIEEYGAAMPAKQRAALDETLADIAKKGYAAIKSTIVPGITDVSVPVLNNGVAVASLAIPYMKRTGVPVSQRAATDMLSEVALIIASKLA